MESVGQIAKKSGYVPSIAILAKAKELKASDALVTKLCFDTIRQFPNSEAVYKFDDKLKRDIRLKNDDGSLKTLSQLREGWVIDQLIKGAAVTCEDCSRPTPFTYILRHYDRTARLCEKCSKAYYGKTAELRDTEEREDREREAKRKFNELYVDSGLRKRHQEMTLGNWLGSRINQIENYELVGESLNIFVYGPTGSGKTYAIVALLHKLMMAENRIFFINAIELLSRIKASFNPQNREGHRETTTEEIIDNFSSVPFLTIDDLGSEKGSEWVIETFYLILNRRYEACLPTFVTSNLSPKELASKLGDRFTSRLFGHNTIVIKIDSEDRRL